MPTTPGTTSNQALTPQQTLQKLSGLITEIGDDDPKVAEPAEQGAEVDAGSPPEAPESEQSPPAPSDTPETPDDEASYEVKVDGEPVQVSLADLKRSYSSQAHNTQRAQELSEREKTLEPSIRARVAEEMLAERQQHQQAIADFRAAYEKITGEPDWATLHKQLEPGEFLKQKADWEAAKADIQRLKAEEDRLAQQNAAEQQKLYQQYLRAEEDKLRAAIPEWSDVPKGKAELAQLATFVRTTYGIPDSAVANAFTSAAAILLARDAKRYRELQREPSPKPKTAGIKTAKPGTPERPRPNARQEQLIAQTKSGRQRDAMKAIESMLPDE